jgi:serine/threonine protein kinase
MSSDPLIGKQLANFRIERLLGRGGMAEVYYGWDVKLERPVAIKVINARFRDNTAFARRFVREAQMIARWRHENIMQVYYADEQEGLYYFIMEYIDGLSLDDLLGQYRKDATLMPHTDVLRIGYAVADALDYAHKRQLIHRDVKPANILVSGDGRVVLTDFGLALDVNEGSVGEVMGTPHYIAPEQAQRSDQAVPQSDLYSLGVVLFEMLCGDVPFDDPSPVVLALQHINAPTPLIRQFNASLNEDTEMVLFKALSKNPAERYQSGKALMDALSQSLGYEQDVETARFNSASIQELVEARMREGGTMPILPDRVSKTPAMHRDLATPGLPRTSRPKPGPNLFLIGVVVLGVGLVAAAAGGLAMVGLFGPSAATPAPTRAIELATETPEATEIAQGVDTETPQPVIQMASPTTQPASETPEPTLTPTLSVSPTATVLYPDGHPVTLFYNVNSFFLWNAGDVKIDIRLIAFEALNPDGSPAPYAFKGSSWAAFYNEIERKKCDSVEIFGRASRWPDQCLGLNASRTPLGDAPEVFWVAHNGSTQFRVLWNDSEIARCAIDAGQCEVFLP